MDEWVTVPGAIGYEVTKDGKARKSKLNYLNGSAKLRVFVNPYGYASTAIRFDCDNKNRTITVHRLVALAFIPNPNNKPQVNHIDGNRLNNHYTNLEWVTHLENLQHGIYVLGWLVEIKKCEPITLNGVDIRTLHHQTGEDLVILYKRAKGLEYALN